MEQDKFSIGLPYNSHYVQCTCTFAYTFYLNTDLRFDFNEN